MGEPALKLSMEELSLLSICHGGMSRGEMPSPHYPSTPGADEKTGPVPHQLQDSESGPCAVSGQHSRTDPKGVGVEDPTLRA